MLAEARARKKYIKEAQVLISSSGTSVARKQYSQAIDRLQAAVALTRVRKVNRLLADAQFELASVYRTTGDLKRAEQMAAAATSASQSSGEIYELPQRLLYLAQIEASLGKYAEADATYDRAADFVDTMVGSVSRVATKAALITATSEIFSEHFSLLADDLTNISKAYEVVERARGAATTDLLRTGARPNTAYDRQVDRQIAKLRLDLLDTRNSAQIKRIRDRIFLVEQTRWLSPLPTTLSSASHNTIPLERLRRTLDPEEVLLEYVLAEPRSHCLVITRERARIVALPGRAEIEEIVSSYLETIKSKRTSTALGQQLFDAVLRPVTEMGQKKRILIVRDGQLHLLPFDALIDPASRYLAETYTITYAPSATTWYVLRTMPATQVAQRTLLGVGGVPYDTTSSLTKLATTRGYTANQLSNLPASKDEVLVAADAVQNPNNTLLIGPAATESAFKNSRLDRYKVIHLAVHGVANSERPDQAALILLSDAAAGEDGILQASEVLQLRINADLVVLSACDTAIGRLQGGEGIANLSRAFLLSGAHAVVATLWSIDDTFSLNLMKQFYAHLASGKSIAISLSEAKRDTLRTFGTQAVPYYWAGFTLEGIGERPVILRSADAGIPSQRK
jgi:CHAT domain-containing protein